ncbi:Uncharacterised protein [Mycobacteroides abscessus subsp. massiliense]|uniref:hypothetical protein n=1 Tax=Mycobacteroides abscessus TaxID=36809 RepID=UPI0009A90C77|nr:hypothetical protein [Mycobacteroides abscessus]SLE48120.1 Uncharacterised protein [Mycobacteroides abscessus subsp. massiliense]
MNRFQFVKPSLGRVVGMTIAAIALVCVIAGIVLYIGLITTHHDDGATAGGDYVRLFFVSIFFYAPMFLLIVWQVTIPGVLALGVLAASLRKDPSP